MKQSHGHRHRLFCLQILLVALTCCACISGRRDVNTPTTGDKARDVNGSVITFLFFGMSSMDGPGVSAQEWQGFLDDVVTPRFPSGLTVLEAAGQFQPSTGGIVAERSKVLLLVIRAEAAAGSSIV